MLKPLDKWQRFDFVEFLNFSTEMLSMMCLKIDYKQKSSLLKERGEQRTTLMMFIVLLSFAMCNTLPFVLNMLETTKADFFMNPQTKLLAFALNDSR